MSVIREDYLVFLPDVPGPATPRGDVVYPALAVRVDADELLEPEDEHVGPESAMEQGGVPWAGHQAHTLDCGQHTVSGRYSWSPWSTPHRKSGVKLHDIPFIAPFLTRPECPIRCTAHLCIVLNGSYKISFSNCLK